MTDREKAIVMAYTGAAMLAGDKFSIFHKYIEDICGRPIYTHEIAILAEEIKEKSRADFLELCREETSACDCISRKEAVNALRKSLYDYEDNTEKQFLDSNDLNVSDWFVHRIFVQNMNDADVKAINDLPSIQQEPKTGHCKDCKWWKDSDGTYRRGVRAESKCPINCREVFEGNGYCYMFEAKMESE